MRGRVMKKIVIAAALSVLFVVNGFGVDISLTEIKAYAYEMRENVAFYNGSFIQKNRETGSIDYIDPLGYEFKPIVEAYDFFGILGGKIFYSFMDKETYRVSYYLYDGGTGEKTLWDTKWFNPEQRVVEYQNGQFFGALTYMQGEAHIPVLCDLNSRKITKLESLITEKRDDKGYSFLGYPTSITPDRMHVLLYDRVHWKTHGKR